MCKRYLCWNFPHCLKMQLKFKLVFYLFRKVFLKGQAFLNSYTFLWPDEGYYDYSYNKVWPGLFWYHYWKWHRTVLFTACTTSDILHLSYSQHIPQKVQNQHEFVLLTSLCSQSHKWLIFKAWIHSAPTSHHLCPCPRGLWASPAASSSFSLPFWCGRSSSWSAP